MNQLEINLKAAKMLGLRGVEEGDCKTAIHYPHLDYQQFFDLFTNPSDTLAVVKMLGEKHGISIMLNDSLAGKEWFWRGVRGFAMGMPMKTYEEAVGAAVEAVNGVTVKDCTFEDSGHGIKIGKND